MISRNFILFISLLVILLFSGCEKFLLKKPYSGVAIPHTLRDLQAMLDAGNNMNFGAYSQLNEPATDDFFMASSNFQIIGNFEQDIYLWKDYPIFATVDENVNWTIPFRVISIANTVLDELPNIQNTKGLVKESIEGSALFFRAFAYLNLVQIYAKAYNPATADLDLGLPLRLTSDINQSTVRSTLKQTFDLIESDASKAYDLLPETSDHLTRPNKIAALALKARMYLIMENYSEALKYATQCLEKYDTLLDYNELDNESPYPIPAMNKETIFFAFASGASFLHSSIASYVDTLLFDSYDDNDLRKSIYFKDENNGYHSFRGSYIGNGAGTSFVGFTVSELLLIKAEAHARNNEVAKSLSALNYLLENRYKRNEYQTISISGSEELLIKILQERRKELIFRGTRWTDLKRLNRDPRFEKTLYRKIPGDTSIISLPPNDKRYVFLIPQLVINMTGIKQNER